ncbi:hypothetical protein SLEP1_g1392 [Rubroshorea leprosula]|uniref:GATA-type domain-containing protein n=1 Tax=Rubroshorea leprosula TaxID=152421 RepID=A0AAV5HLY8_9ROSI|nr:hypothetical protein SLEP1_g1392 [Rubroshorea leprosula]
MQRFLQQRGVKEVNRSCVDCHTTRTPLWRGGPAGPKSLCNACGIKYRKRKKALLGLGKERIEMSKRENGMEMLLRRKLLGEEEKAAMLLMALSCGSVHAWNRGKI